MSSSMDNSVVNGKEINSWKSERRPSINLLDLNELLTIQSNTFSSRQVEGKPNESKSEGKSKISYASLQKFDPLQTRTEKVSPVMDNEEKIQQTTKMTPTRLPTPRRPTLSSHISAEYVQVNLITMDQVINQSSSSSNAMQLDPTPPSSPGRRIRQTSIARLAKPPTRESLGKANRDLAEFDPLISPIKDKRLSGSYTETISKLSAKKGAQVKNVYIYKLSHFFFLLFFFLFFSC